jgi:hypothetical protein
MSVPPGQPIPRPHPIPQPKPTPQPQPKPTPETLTPPDVVLEMNGDSDLWLSQAQSLTNIITKKFPGGVPIAIPVPAGLGLSLPAGGGFVADAQTVTPAGSLLLELGVWLAGPPSSAEQTAMRNGLRQTPIVAQPPQQPDGPGNPNGPDGAISLFLSDNTISTPLAAVFASVAGTSIDLTSILGYEVKATVQSASASFSMTAPVITTTLTGSVNWIPSVGFTATITDTLSVVPGQGLVCTPTVSVDDAGVSTDVILALLSAVLLQPAWLAAASSLFFGLQAVAIATQSGKAGLALPANSPGTLLAALVNRATTVLLGGSKITSTITSVGTGRDFGFELGGLVVNGNFFLGVPDPTISLVGSSEVQWPEGDSALVSAPVTYTAVTNQIQEPVVTWSLDTGFKTQSPTPAFQFGLCDEQVSQGIVFPSPGTALGDKATRTLTVKAVDGTVSGNPVVFTASMPVLVTVVKPPPPPLRPPPPIGHPPEP